MSDEEARERLSQLLDLALRQRGITDHYKFLEEYDPTCARCRGATAQTVVTLSCAGCGVPMEFEYPEAQFMAALEFECEACNAKQATGEE